MHPPLIQSLLHPDAFPHAVTQLDLIETHISWVILTGPYAYKIKKPVNLGFLDFSTLERRRHFCGEELRLNQRFAPQLYLEVVPIGGSALQPRVGDEPALEYAVKMVQFEQAQRLDHELARNALSADDMDALAHTIARAHECAARAEAAQPWGTPDAIWAPVAENFAHIRAQPLDTDARLRLERIEHWSAQQHAVLRALMQSRKDAGCVRECHGDLHTHNLVRLATGITAFDCIEFNASFRWIDVMSEVAFLLMDFDAHARHELAWRFLNTYLEACGDYSGVALLRFYQTYRAMVRAKVARIQERQSESRAAGTARVEFHRYLALAERYTALPRPQLVIMHGLSGSGKSTVSRVLADHYGLIRLRSDVERKRLHGLAPEAHSGSALGEGIYTSHVTEQVYAHLARLAETVLRAGYGVVVDAAFLQRTQRQMLRSVAQRLDIPFHILHCEAGAAELRARLRARTNDPSEADLTVLEHQLRSTEPLDAAEHIDQRSLATLHALLANPVNL